MLFGIWKDITVATAHRRRRKDPAECGSRAQRGKAEIAECGTCREEVWGDDQEVRGDIAYIHTPIYPTYSMSDNEKVDDLFGDSDNEAPRPAASPRAGSSKGSPSAAGDEAAPGSPAGDVDDLVCPFSDFCSVRAFRANGPVRR
jgi:hypothetical protein